MVRTLFLVLSIFSAGFASESAVSLSHAAEPDRLDRPAAIKIFSPNIPPAGNCRALSAQFGADKVWFGRFSGRYQDDWNESMVWPVNARGCFASEYECRRWLNEVQSAVVLPGLMSCRILAQDK